MFLCRCAYFAYLPFYLFVAERTGFRIASDAEYASYRDFHIAPVLKDLKP